MRKVYPYQAHIRFPTEGEKQKAEEFAEKRGLSLANAARLALARAIREKWEFGPATKPKAKK